ncbi:hypothetical protein LCD52_09545 [Rossellomorea vietnamensis]|uniref:hypothetical protein n=1 Tax=Rossellomorea TaxID=2837508 RepID=UPI001CCCC1E1|nr:MULTISPECIES: hypothetical protein [Rossellomorea]MCA0149050.1 hypothetical protein [Rossellomorea vietnamensis]UTE79056.1 hypothetical protein M1J35_10130 [Rossellomorea sp. KS-H15a]
MMHHPYNQNPYLQHQQASQSFNPYHRETKSLPDQWVEYIQPLVTRALSEVEEGINLTHLFQEFILSGVLVGQGFTPEQAIEQVETWEKGESKLLQASKAMK